MLLIGVELSRGVSCLWNCWDGMVLLKKIYYKLCPIGGDLIWISKDCT